MAVTRRSKWRIRKRDGSLPLGGTLGGGGLSPLASQGAQRPRRLGRKGEGVTLGVLAARVTPSPSFSKLATLVKRKSPPPPRGRVASRFVVASLTPRLTPSAAAGPPACAV